MRNRLRLIAPVVLFVAWFSLIGITLSEAHLPINAVTYGGTAHVPVIAPIESEVCAGGVLRFPLVTFVGEDELPGQINVAESWCLVGLTGGCIGVVPDRPDMPLLRVKEVTLDSTSRTVPETLKPGVYEFWHSNTDSHGGVAGYIVGPITVRACAP